MKQTLINHIAFVLDKSASMTHLVRSLESVFDNEIEHLKQRSLELNQETRVSVYTFNEKVECLVFDKDVTRMTSLKNTIKAGHNTALLDAVYTAIRDMSKLPELHGDHAFLVYALTDGEENASSWDPYDFSDYIKRLKDNWTVVCMVPDTKGVYEAKKFGFHANNIQIWKTTEKGLEEAGRVQRGATFSYMNLRSQGIRSTTNFYNTDLSNVTTFQVKKKLDELDVSEYLLFRVGNKDRVIRDFVESWTKKPYRIGSAYYELVKTEEIQSGKEICIQHRKDGRVYSGHNARVMLGFPDYVVRVKPGDHGDWRIFVQSTSVNRKLPAHTQVLVLK